MDVQNRRRLFEEGIPRMKGGWCRQGAGMVSMPSSERIGGIKDNYGASCRERFVSGRCGRATVGPNGEYQCHLGLEARSCR